MVTRWLFSCVPPNFYIYHQLLCATVNLAYISDSKQSLQYGSYGGSDGNRNNFEIENFHFQKCYLYFYFMFLTIYKLLEKRKNKNVIPVKPDPAYYQSYNGVCTLYIDIFICFLFVFTSRKRKRETSINQLPEISLILPY